MRRLWSKLTADQPPWVIVLFAALFLCGSLRFFVAKRGPQAKPEVAVGTDGRYQWAFIGDERLSITALRPGP